MDDKIKRRPNQISLSRVKTIMKSSPEVENIAQESVYLVAKATECFIKAMVEDAFKGSGNAATLDYKHVSELVQTKAEYAFLKEIVPRKMTLKEIKEKGLKLNLASSPSPQSSDDELSFFEPMSPPPLPSDDLAEPSCSTAGSSFGSAPTRVATPPAKGGKISKLNLKTKTGTARKMQIEDMDIDVEALSPIPEVMIQSPGSAISMSSASRATSPSPSFSSLSPQPSTQNQDDDGASSHSSDCQIID